MTFPFPRLLLVLTLLVAFPGLAEASRYRTPGPGIQPGSGIDIEVHTLFERTPMRGFAPVRITISNNSGSAHTWRVVFESTQQFISRTSLTHEAVLTIADGEAKRFDIMVPLMRTGQHSGKLTARVYGHGIDPKDRQLVFPSPPAHPGGRDRPAATAMSASLWIANVASLGTRPRSSIYVSAFDPSLMPTDWRAYAGLHAVWLTDREWLSTGAAERAALLDWVATGGQLYVCREEDVTSSLPGIANLAEKQPVNHGFGAIHLWLRTGDDLTLDLEGVHNAGFTENATTHSSLQHSYHRYSWTLLTKLPDLKVRPVLFIGFLLFFGVLVGPINLLFFARGSNRYRLFWTTPAISAGASLVMIVLILFQDGVGGTGHQLAVWSHLPGENKAVFIQEQASRTALLTKRDFSVDLPVSLSPIQISSLGPTGSTRLQAGQRSYSGDWFRNRSIQGQLIKGVIATRWRIEAVSPLNPGTAPQLLSTFPFTLESLFYRDAEGLLWHTSRLQTGQSAHLEAVDDDVFEEAWKAFNGDAGAIIEHRLRAFAGSRMRFFAFSDDSPESILTTLDAIDWKTRKSLHTGPLALSNP